MTTLQTKQMYLEINFTMNQNYEHGETKKQNKEEATMKNDTREI